jgi:hypothetical protein
VVGQVAVSVRAEVVGVPSSDVGIGLSEAIAQIRADLLAVRAAGEDADIRFPVQSVTVELKVIACKEAGGRAGFKVPFADFELGGSGSWSSERTSVVTIVLGAPVDGAGQPIKVTQSSDSPKL